VGHTQMLELPQPVYLALMKVAEASGMTPADWIAANLPRWARENGETAKAQLTDAEKDAADARLDQHIVSLGYATGIDNEAIDADLMAHLMPPSHTPPRRVPGIDAGRVFIAPDFDAPLQTW